MSYYGVSNEGVFSAVALVFISCSEYMPQNILLYRGTFLETSGPRAVRGYDLR